MESLKAKSKEFEKIKVEIENAISKKELEQKRVDSIQKVNDAEDRAFLVFLQDPVHHFSKGNGCHNIAHILFPPYI